LFLALSMRKKSHDRHCTKRERMNYSIATARLNAIKRLEISSIQTMHNLLS
jgi:hypothetical protein